MVIGKLLPFAGLCFSQPRAKGRMMWSILSLIEKSVVHSQNPGLQLLWKMNGNCAIDFNVSLNWSRKQQVTAFSFLSGDRDIIHSHLVEINAALLCSKCKSVQSSITNLNNIQLCYMQYDHPKFHIRYLQKITFKYVNLFSIWWKHDRRGVKRYVNACALFLLIKKKTLVLLCT